MKTKIYTFTEEAKTEQLNQKQPEILVFQMGNAKKKAQMFVKLVSAAGTGFFYVKRKPRQFTEKLK
ncbi:ribosomal protein L33 family protein, putative [Medicago truncatula]|uniref:Ribosomal protein L33 family protein, putative n=1 Tax=Medicago truncatula TaxID=3880 RepID=G7I6C7_MEDTR|nr:ribosomal protein L33 family protein, putative [Medicago truncatula]